MSLPVRFTEEAEADVEEAFLWYFERGQDLGDGFLESLGLAVDAIRRNPEAYPVIHRDVRRLLLRRFPYGLFYRLERDGLRVVACFHARRDPRSWQRRV